MPWHPEHIWVLPCPVTGSPIAVLCAAAGALAAAGVLGVAEDAFCAAAGALVAAGLCAAAGTFCAFNNVAESATTAASATDDRANASLFIFFRRYRCTARLLHFPAAPSLARAVQRSSSES